MPDPLLQIHFNFAFLDRWQTFTRLFRECTGPTPFDHVLNLRLEEACTMLHYDEASLDRIVAVKALVQVRGASVRYLPASSPDFNPVEMDFAKLKANLRQFADRTRVFCGLALGKAHFVGSREHKKAAHGIMHRFDSINR
jgi:hypothetical protein